MLSDLESGPVSKFLHMIYRSGLKIFAYIAASGFKIFTGMVSEFLSTSGFGIFA